jgi:hypothetical protein
MSLQEPELLKLSMKKLKKKYGGAGKLAMEHKSMSVSHPINFSADNLQDIFDRILKHHTCQILKKAGLGTKQSFWQ